MSAANIRISLCLQDLARGIEGVLTDVAGEPVSFSLFVWTKGRAQYIANCQRPDVIRALEEMIEGWKAGMPDVPTHEVQ